MTEASVGGAVYTAWALLDDEPCVTSIRFTYGHVGAEWFLDLLEAEGLTCDIDNCWQGYMSPSIEEGPYCSKEPRSPAGIPITGTARWKRKRGVEAGWERLS